MTVTQPPGSLVCVSVGVMLGSHISPLVRSHIETSEVVFLGVADSLMEQWLMRMNPDTRSLQPFYREGTSRMQTYRQMVHAMLREVRAGRLVLDGDIIAPADGAAMGAQGMLNTVWDDDGENLSEFNWYGFLWSAD